MRAFSFLKINTALYHVHMPSIRVIMLQCDNCFELLRPHGKVGSQQIHLTDLLINNNNFKEFYLRFNKSVHYN